MSPLFNLPGNAPEFKTILQAIKDDAPVLESDLVAIKPNINEVLFWDNQTLLMYAIEYGRKSVVEKLIAYGADVNAASPYRITPLMIAASKGNVELVQLLLFHNADPTIQRKLIRRGSASTMAADAGHHELAKLLKNEENKIRKL